ncbi:hypothetical protein A0H81_05530 [Grifola frondosa]|uniref:Uncharacterized protein n=1 Tax=Grifola frondosa TaxID=5627 RepID=A0A1C7MC90_GRIFR|nr:hypothetical protein A0H81_05530 [Grifola frondosa]
MRAKSGNSAARIKIIQKYPYLCKMIPAGSIKIDCTIHLTRRPPHDCSKVHPHLIHHLHTPPTPSSLLSL